MTGSHSTFFEHRLPKKCATQANVGLTSNAVQWDKKLLMIESEWRVRKELNDLRRTRQLLRLHRCLEEDRFSAVLCTTACAAAESNLCTPAS